MASQRTEDVIQRASRLYEEKLREKLEKTNMHEFVAIEPDSEEFFLGQTLSEAIQASRAAYPDRLAFAIRIGNSTAVEIGVLET